MSTNADTEDEGTRARRRSRRGSWAVPALTIILGGVYLGIELGHHHVGLAVAELGIMLAYAAVLVVGSRRSEAVSLLRGVSQDERGQSIEQSAAALTLYVLALVLVGGFIVAMIRGRDETLWGSLCAVLGGVYILSTFALTRSR